MKAIELLASGTKPKKAAVRLVHLVPGLVSVATNAAYTRLGRWAASNACSIKTFLCVLNVRARPNSPDCRVETTNAFFSGDLWHTPV